MKIKIFYLVLMLGFIFSWFYLVDFGQIAEMIVNVRWQFIFLAVGLGLIKSLFGALRFKTLLSTIGNVSFGYIWGLGYLAALITLIFPFSLGGLSLAYILAKKTKSSYAKSFLVVFVDFILGVLITLALGMLGIFYFANQRLLSARSEIYNFIFLFLIGIAIVILLITIFFIFKSKINILENFFVLIKESLVLFNSKIVTTSLILTAIIFSLGAASLYLYYLAFAMKPKVLDFILATSLFGILGMIPGTPTKLGQYETFGVLTLPYLLKLDKNSVFAMLLVQHAIEITIVFLIGLGAIYFLKLNPWQIKDRIS